MNGKDYIILLCRHLLPYMQSMGSGVCLWMTLPMPSISGSNSVDAVQRSETNGGVATTKSRSKSNVACLGHFRSKT